MRNLSWSTSGLFGLLLFLMAEEDEVKESVDEYEKDELLELDDNEPEYEPEEEIEQEDVQEVGEKKRKNQMRRMSDYPGACTISIEQVGIHY